jgi:hypothetical protein
MDKPVLAVLARVIVQHQFSFLCVYLPAQITARAGPPIISIATVELNHITVVCILELLRSRTSWFCSSGNEKHGPSMQLELIQQKKPA